MIILNSVDKRPNIKWGSKTGLVLQFEFVHVLILYQNNLDSYKLLFQYVTIPRQNIQSQDENLLVKYLICLKVWFTFTSRWREVIRGYYYCEHVNCELANENLNLKAQKKSEDWGCEKCEVSLWWSYYKERTTMT